MKRRRKHIGCSVVARNGRLRLRFRWQGKRYARVTALSDTPQNRAQLEKLANLIAATIAAGRNPLTLFEQPVPGTPARTASTTVRDYFQRWIEDKVPPIVRKAQARDYRKHIENYVLAELGNVPIAELAARDILGLRAQLLQRGLSLKYVKNIIAGSFKAMIRDAREIDQLLNHDPFVGVRWPRIGVPGPDPFSADERNRILFWFRTKRFGFHSGMSKDGPRLRVHPPFYAYVHALFWTGMRPSEASGLQWGDVDLVAGIARIVRSRHMGEDSATKTGPAARTVELMPETVRLLREMQPLHVAPDAYVFTNMASCPIEPDAFLKRWYSCLRVLGIRMRGLYSMKDTYVSTALTCGVNPAWLEAQTGVRYDTLKRHYGKWLRSEGADQLKKLAGLDPQLDPRNPDVTEVLDFVDDEEWRRGESNPRPEAVNPSVYVRSFVICSRWQRSHEQDRGQPARWFSSGAPEHSPPLIPICDA